jgi:hypothetical protein
MSLRAVALAALLSSSLAGPAQGTKVWTVSHMEEWQKGRPQGVAMSSDGSLTAAPAATLAAATSSTYIWAIAGDQRGNVYAATGAPATVIRIASDGKTTTAFKTKDLAVQAMRVGPDGSIYAATLPSGKVYRLPANATEIDADQATVVFDPAKVDATNATPTHPDTAKKDAGPKYIWDLAFSPDGALYVATGAPAAIYRISQPAAAAHAERFFSSDEQHIRALLFERDGTLLAGSDGDGLVYRIGKDGKGFILFNAPKREVTALAESTDGKIYVATVGEKGKSSLPPLPVQGIAAITATITIVTPGSVQASNSNSLVPDGSEVFELDASSGAARKLWAPRDEVVYALRSTPQGLLAATGNRGRIYRIQENGEFADIAHLDAAQVTSFAEAPAGGLYLATSNSGKLFRLGASNAEGSLQSEVQDAGAVARWGRAEVDGTGYQLFARTGNVSNADRGWSEWKPVAANAPLPVPQARFAQWKLVLKPDAMVHAISLNYLPVNLAPVVDEVAVVPGARVNQQAQCQPPVQPISINLPSASGNALNLQQDASAQPLQGIRDRSGVTARWSAHDDNGDELIFALYYRSAGEVNWQLLKDNLGDRYYSFDAAQLPDGAYQLKVVASDAPSHNPGEALTSERVSERFVLDTQSPTVEALTARLEGGKLHITAEAKDPSSPIARAEYSIDAGPWQFIEPVGKLSDSLTEKYDFQAPLSTQQNEQARVAKLPPADPAQHVVTLRIFDRYDNSATAKSVVR